MKKKLFEQVDGNQFKISEKSVRPEPTSGDWQKILKLAEKLTNLQVAGKLERFKFFNEIVVEVEIVLEGYQAPFINLWTTSTLGAGVHTVYPQDYTYEEFKSGLQGKAASVK